MDLEDEIRMLEAQVAQDSAIVAAAGQQPQSYTENVQQPNMQQPGSKPAPRFAHDADERSIFVSGLPTTSNEVTPERLAAHFEDCGQILKCTVLRNKQTNELKGTAYVEFASHEAVGRALDSKNNSTFMGRPLSVSRKRSLFNANRARGSQRGRGAAGGFGRGGGPMELVSMMTAAVMSAALAMQGGGNNIRGGRGGRISRGRGSAPAYPAVPDHSSQGMLPSPPPTVPWPVANPFQ